MLSAGVSARPLKVQAPLLGRIIEGGYDWRGLSTLVPLRFAVDIAADPRGRARRRGNGVPGARTARLNWNSPMNTVIESAIRPVCDSLNRIPRVTTLWSCQGHPFRLSRPYVVFMAPESVALDVHRLLGAGDGAGALRYPWWLNANFRDSGDLQWCLEPNYRFPRWQYLPLARRTVDDELLRLAALIRTLHR